MNTQVHERKPNGASSLELVMCAKEFSASEKPNLDGMSYRPVIFRTLHLEMAPEIPQGVPTIRFNRSNL